jgi:hypothetical protein
MNADEVIECYVTDVAVLLPRKQRNDVAFELRALLREELQAKADAAGRPADAAMAIEFLRAFGSPADVAARYRPTLTVIDPADGPTFWRWTVIGLAIIWVLGLIERLRPLDSGWDVLNVVGQWWVGTAIPSLWWPGVLVLYFGLASWTHRRWPRVSRWTPRAEDRLDGGRASIVLAVAGVACGLYVLFEPRWVLDFFWAGNAAPQAYEALTYTDTFRQRQGPILYFLIALNIPLMLIGFVQGRRSPTLRRIEQGVALLTCAAMVWTALDGPIFNAARSDQTAKFLLVMIVVFVLVGYAIVWYRKVRPTPGAPVQAPR